MSERTIGPKEQQLRNLRASKAAKKGWVAKKKQQVVRLIRKIENRKPK